MGSQIHSVHKTKEATMMGKLNGCHDFFQSPEVGKVEGYCRMLVDGVSLHFPFSLLKVVHLTPSEFGTENEMPVKPE